MVNELIVPESILDKIAEDGVAASAESAKSTGILTGQYDDLDKIILVSGEYKLAPQLRTDAYEPELVNLISKFWHIDRYLQAVVSGINNNKKVKNNGLTPSIITYHTQKSGIWLPKDRKPRQRFDSLYARLGIKYARLMYTMQEGIFLAMDGSGNNIPVKSA